MKEKCQICSEESDDCITIDERTVCPVCKPAFVQAFKEGVELVGKGCWASNDLLVIREGALLPERCIKCNHSPAKHGKEKKLIFQATTFPILGSLIILFSRFIGKGTRLTFSLCGKCSRKVIIGRFFVALALIQMYVIGAVVRGQPSQSLLAKVGLVTFFGLAIVGFKLMFNIAFVSSQGGYDMIKGAGKAFLDSLPQFERSEVEQEDEAAGGR
jgi:hypothetical protein